MKNNNLGVEVVSKILGNHTYTLYEDAGHAWIKVSIAELIALNILVDITPFSYIKGRFAFLEEDCDMTTFFTAYQSVTDRSPRYRNSVSSRSRIRGYDSYTAELAASNFMKGL